MSFTLSKIAWFLVQPSSLIAFLLIGGSILLLRDRIRWGKRLLGSGVFLYLAAGFSPLGNWLILPLEERIPRAEIEGEAIAGIVVLGGALDTIIGLSRGAPSLNEAGERMTETAALALRFPQAPVVFSGGAGGIFYGRTEEAKLARNFFSSLGIEEHRLKLEDQSRNTAENVAFTAQMLNGVGKGRWVLVTSAFHMPRALALFLAQGIPIAPWPVDYRTRGGQDAWRIFPRASEGLRRVDLASREWAGLLVSWLRGLIASPFPDAGTIAANKKDGRF